MTKGGLSLVDQISFSGANAVGNLFLARWLSPADYGAFSIVYTAFLFLSGFHNAFVLEPLSSVGPARYTDAMATYMPGVLWIQLVISGATALVCWAASMVVVDPALSGTFRILSYTAPAILLLWLLRRIAYVRFEPGRAAAASIIYLTLMLALLPGLRVLMVPSPSTGFIAMAVASALAAALMWKSLRMPLTASCIAGGVNAHTHVFSEHWSVGKWLAVTSVLYAATGHVQMLLVGRLGLEAAGALRAMMNFILPMTQITTAIATLALPALARASATGERHHLRRKAHLVTAVLTAVASVYAIVLCAVARPLESVLYQEKFGGYVWLLPILACQPVLGAFAAGYSVALRALRKTRQCFIATAIAAPVGLLSSVLFLRWWGLAGLAVSMTATCLVAAAALFRFATVALEEE